MNEEEQEQIEALNAIGKLVQENYDEFVVQGGSMRGYNLYKLKGSLKFKPNSDLSDNLYWLEGINKHWTDIANYFEYGTGLNNKKEAGGSRRNVATGRFQKTYDKKSPIVPRTKPMLKFIGKGGNWISTAEVQGVYPIFAKQKAIKHVENLMKGAYND